MKRWALEIDVKRCINCSNCVLATKDEYFGNVFPGYSAEQPPKASKRSGLFVTCAATDPHGCQLYPEDLQSLRQCPCVKAAGDGAIYKRPDGIVVIDPVKSKNRRDLVDACPYGMILWNGRRRSRRIGTLTRICSTRGGKSLAAPRPAPPRRSVR